ncbi:putative glycosyltransferase [Halovivax ruber XH-70]|uniref:Putative glycosyltransferase n=1 Tax=Halovivax ruber (strain DSM 18193 / JCM 13892 / XH-70) TaxID=797302 RepID=L0IBJ7_HALRX|nr:glucosyl-dolichyl phosphate glucuronosyltransferase [Halovivax ruber]AGB15621.1 putative glycosyltransferase [Halovivax ruber XH-70]
MDVSVVVCTYSLDRYADFRECVESIRSQTYDPIEVVLVVDGNERTFDRLRDEFGGLEETILHCNETNLGVSASRTEGARLASGDIVAFIDDDAVADPEWVETLVETYEATDALAVGGRMTGRWLAGRPWYLPEEFDWIVGVTHRGFAEAGEEVRNTFESNISFTRDVFLELGGFNPELGPDAESYGHGEGAEIGLRLQRRFDRGIVYEPDAVVEHKVFEHRTALRWILARAFEQGRSKRMLAAEGESTATEVGFLRELFFQHVPRRVSELFRSPSLSTFGETLMLFVLTAAVGLGYGLPAPSFGWR